MATVKNRAMERIANNMTSSELIHPGEMIKDEIMARGLTQKELAQQMGVSYTVFNEQHKQHYRFALLRSRGQ